MIRPWQRKGRWSPEEAAAELQRRRAGLIGQLRRRSEARGVPAGAQEEIVDDAITAVVMAPRGVANEHHLIGAFWLRSITVAAATAKDGTSLASARGSAWSSTWRLRRRPTEPTPSTRWSCATASPEPPT